VKGIAKKNVDKESDDEKNEKKENIFEPRNFKIKF
jgi:hypothetical protein